MVCGGCKIIEPQNINTLPSNQWIKVSAPIGRASVLYPLPAEPSGSTSDLSGILWYRPNNPSANHITPGTPGPDCYRGLGKRQVCVFPGTPADNPFWYVYYEFFDPGTISGDTTLRYTILDIGQEEMLTFLQGESQGMSAVVDRQSTAVDATIGTQIVAPNVNRRGFELQLAIDAPANVWINDGILPVAPTPGVGFCLEPGGTYELYGDSLHGLGVWAIGDGVTNVDVFYVEYE